MLQRTLITLSFACFANVSCKHTGPIPADGDANYPPEVARIVINKCATSGCHNAASYENAGGLRLDSWENMFAGGTNGAAVVPYSTDFSPLLYYINNDSSAGVVAEPRMPRDMPPLSKQEYNVIRDWIAAGAPSKKGEIPFASDADTRQKIYLTMQACDQVAVIDAKSKLVMRYIPVGTSPTIEAPHCLRVSPDGKYAFVSFSTGSPFQKIETSTDKVVENIPLSNGSLTPGSWNVFLISPDGTKVMISDWQGSGSTVHLDLLTMKQRLYNNVFKWPHGVASNPTFDTFYVVSQSGNALYKFDLDGFLPPTLISIDGTPPITGNDTGFVSRNPHEIVMSPDYSVYFITCEKSNEVRVMSRKNDSCVAAIPVGAKPQEIAISKKNSYVFVTCMEDVPTKVANATFRGSVYVISCKPPYNVVKVINGNFSSPHGITVDDINNTFYFASINNAPGAPIPHHVSKCAGANGFYKIYDMATFQPADKRRFEVLPFPYSADSRFK